MFSVQRMDPHNLKRQFEQLPKRLENLRIAIGNSIASEIKKDVVKRIPNESGWLRIYRNAIDVNYSTDGEWVVGGEKELPISAVDANVTLITFTGSETDKASSVLTAYNPWPIDMVPAINAAYTSRINMKASSVSEVQASRSRIKNVMDDVKDKLSRAGYSIDPNGLPKFSGKTIADLAFLAQRLENGLGGFPRIPHWKPAADNISASKSKAVKSITPQFESILRGNVGTKPRTLTSKLKQMLSSAVRRSPGK